jgi:hypothetical protein
MTDPSKIDAVRSYLQATFPQHEIQDRSRGENGHDFKLSSGGSAYNVTVKRSFLDDHAPEEIDDILRRWQMERALKKSETAGVIVGNGGLCVAWPDAPPS